MDITTSVELLAVRLKDAVKDGRFDDLKVSPALALIINNYVCIAWAQILANEINGVRLSLQQNVILVRMENENRKQ